MRSRGPCIHMADPRQQCRSHSSRYSTLAPDRAPARSCAGFSGARDPPGAGLPGGGVGGHVQAGPRPAPAAGVRSRAGRCGRTAPGGSGAARKAAPQARRSSTPCTSRWRAASCTFGCPRSAGRARQPPFSALPGRGRPPARRVLTPGSGRQHVRTVGAYLKISAICGTVSRGCSAAPSGRVRIHPATVLAAAAPARLRCPDSGQS